MGYPVNPISCTGGQWLYYYLNICFVARRRAYKNNHFALPNCPRILQEIPWVPWVCEPCSGLVGFHGSHLLGQCGARTPASVYLPSASVPLGRFAGLLPCPASLPALELPGVSVAPRRSSRLCDRKVGLVWLGPPGPLVAVGLAAQPPHPRKLIPSLLTRLGSFLGLSRFDVAHL